MKFPSNPQNILLIKSHSMGIGDLLRSSAAWTALKAKWPQSRLHFLMLSNHAGYASETFMRSHYLLDSANFVTVKTGDPGSDKQEKLPLTDICNAIDEALRCQAIDMVIDFETGGLKTPWITRWIAMRKGAFSVGVAQFPMRGWFYDIAAPSSRDYRARYGLERQMDYTHKDFVALAALGIARKDTAITLRLTPAALAWQVNNPLQLPPGRKLVVLNIGCGTTDALPKRPDLGHLAKCMLALLEHQPFDLHLSGAPFERQVNVDFQKLFQSLLHNSGKTCNVVDWAGELTLEQLEGLLQRADMTVSSDSGPYHMAVALGVPTLCWFNFDTPPSYHRQEGVECLILPTVDKFVEAADRLLRCS